ncbi:hypothetical protein HWV62_23174, partial [Athelia sp. TMB]
YQIMASRVILESGPDNDAVPERSIHSISALPSPTLPSSPITDYFLLPGHETGTLTGGYLPYDNSYFYVDSGDLGNHTSFILCPIALKVVLGDPIIFHEDYAEYDSCFMDRFSGIWHSLILLIPYRVGVPVLPTWSASHFHNWFRGFLSLADLDLPIIAGVHTHVTVVDCLEEDPDAYGYFLMFFRCCILTNMTVLLARPGWSAHLNALMLRVDLIFFAKSLFWLQFDG